MEKLQERLEQLKDAAPKSEKAWEEYMTFFWQGYKYIPRCASRLIVDFVGSEIDITELEFTVGRLFELGQYIGSWSSDGKTFWQLCA